MHLSAHFNFMWPSFLHSTLIRIIDPFVKIKLATDSVGTESSNSCQSSRVFDSQNLIGQNQLGQVKCTGSGSQVVAAE